MSPATHFRVLKILEFHCPAIPKRTRVLERVATTSSFAVGEGKMRVLCSVKSSWLLIAATKVVWERREGL